jgi:hypothetical protein
MKRLEQVLIIKPKNNKKIFMQNMKIKKRKYSLKQKINLKIKNNQNSKIIKIIKNQNNKWMMKVWEFLAYKVIKLTKSLTSENKI